MSSQNMHYLIMRIQDKTRFTIEDRITLLTEPQIPVQLKSVPMCLAMCFGEECQPKQSTCTKPGTRLALPLWMPQGRIMARIQFDFVTMSVKKLLVGQTRSISSPILGWRDFRLTTSSILYEKIGCL